MKTRRKVDGGISGDDGKTLYGHVTVPMGKRLRDLITRRGAAVLRKFPGAKISDEYLTVNFTAPRNRRR